MTLELLLKEIGDNYTRENFYRILKYLRSDTLAKAQFKFFEITFSSTATNFRHRHALGFVPKDVIVTNVSDQESVIFNYDLFTNQYLDITTSGPCTVRFFAGTYREVL